MFVPNLRQNLLSVGKIEKPGLTIVINDGEANIIDQSNTVIGTVFRKGNLYKLIFSFVDIKSKPSKIIELVYVVILAYGYGIVVFVIYQMDI